MESRLLVHPIRLRSGLDRISPKKSDFEYLSQKYNGKVLFHSILTLSFEVIGAVSGKRTA